MKKNKNIFHGQNFFNNLSVLKIRQRTFIKVNIYPYSFAQKYMQLGILERFTMIA